MDNHDRLQMKNPDVMPSNPMLAQVLGDSYAAYTAFQDALPRLDIEQTWQWYTPHKAWFAKGQHFWTTPRGTRKEKNLYWLHVYEGYFCVAVWFKEKNRRELLNADISLQSKQLIDEGETMGKMPIFPVVFHVTTAELLVDIYTLLECKKNLER